MNTAIEIAAGIFGGGSITALAAYFAFTSKFRDYIREAVGKVPEIAATVRQEQRMATHEELHQLRNDFEEFKKLQHADNAEAVEGRRRLHERIDKLPREIVVLLRETKGLL
jgi:hypothetical protein